MSALACFTYLAQNAPEWIKSLGELQTRLQSRQAETARIAVPVAPQIKKTSSNESIRHSELEKSSPCMDRDVVAGLSVWHSQQTTVTATATEPILTPATPSRKRKTASVLSAAASGIHKYRSRASVTVYYDSEVQESFDKLVRNISTGRNNIRKSRMTDRITTMRSVYDRAQEASGMPLPSARVPILRSVRSASGMQSQLDQLLQEGLRSPRGPAPRPPPIAHSNIMEIKSDTAVAKCGAREEVDNALDVAQTLCERGAHQFLRDGDCGQEVAGAKKALEDVVRISVLEMARLKQEEQAAVEAAAERKETLEKAQMRRLDLRTEEATDHSVSADRRTSVAKNPAYMEPGGMIEADDDEDGTEDDFDDPSFLTSPPLRFMART